MHGQGGNKMTRVGIIGAGFMGSMHANVYSMLPDVKIVGIADVRGEKAKSLAAKFKAIPYYDAEQLISKQDVGVIDICLPTYLHKEFAIKAAESGKDIMCEKPIALNVGDADEMIAACRKNKVRLMIGHVIRFWNEYRFLKEVYDRNDYGKLKSLVLRRLSPQPSWSWQDWLLDNERSGGALVDLHIHDTDFVLYLTGKNPQKIYSKITGDGDYSHIVTTFTFENGPVISAEGGWDFPSQYPFEMSYTANFEKATVEFNSRANPSLVVYESSGKTDRPVFDKIKSEGGNGNIEDLGGYFKEIRYFVDHVSHSKQFNVVTPEDARHSLAVLLVEKESADKKVEMLI